MHSSRLLANDQSLNRALKLLISLLLLAVLASASYYYLDRYHATDTPMVDQEIARTRQMAMNDPSNPELRVALAGLYLRKEAYAEAIAQYSEALKVDDGNMGALGGMGLAFFRIGKLEEAAASFERVVELTRDNPPAQRTPVMGSVHYYLGQIYASQGDLTRAENELRLSLGINRADADTVYQLARVVAQQGRTDDAIDLLKAAVTLVPDYEEAYVALAQAYQSQGKHAEEAYALAMVDHTRGNYDAAISRLQSALQARPDFAEAYYGLGASYDKQGERDKAIEAYQRALEHQPNHEAARVSLLRLGVKADPSAPGGR